QQSRANALREARVPRVVVADGAMGAMHQAQAPSREDFQNLEGCTEVLTRTRPVSVRSVDAAKCAGGVDCVASTSYGANGAALGEYDLPARIFELSEAGARIARVVADAHTAADGRTR
ncbi:homocysteine S-methyltransferase family protein, partial [Streptomyces sp. SP17BM10]|uniref:homocysteine S-methyltransferase family protein n=1 Tax=Streptomyces sp. SP17BM10 TaxID=3002530 RepID=UPI002E789AE1